MEVDESGMIEKRRKTQDEWWVWERERKKSGAGEEGDGDTIRRHGARRTRGRTMGKEGVWRERVREWEDLMVAEQ